MRRSQRTSQKTTSKEIAEEIFAPKLPIAKKETTKPRKSKGGQQSKKERVRVWWPPTDDSKRTGYSGMYWPAVLLSSTGDIAEVQYDNGDKETVNTEDIQPNNLPVDFGTENKPIQVGEFVEVFNNSESDPAEWVALVKNVREAAYLVTYPFHSTSDEEVKESSVRRARVWDTYLSKWLFVQPFQEWEDGEVTSPVELCLCTEKELFALLSEVRKKVDSTEGTMQAKQALEKKSNLTSQAGHSKGDRAIETPAEGMSAAMPSRLVPSPSMNQGGLAGDLQKGKKKRKDPNAPRKPWSAYLLYTSQQRERVKEELGPDASAQDVTRKLAESWANTTPEQRALLQEDVDKDRQRYEEEMKHYTPPLGLDDSEEEELPKKRSKKDRDAPKRPRTAYILFSSDFRRNVDKDIDFKAATTMAADAWKNIDAATRAKYEAQALNEKEAYEVAVQVYNRYKEKQEIADQRREEEQKLQAALASAMQGTRPPAAAPPPEDGDVVAGYPTDILQRLDLDAAKQVLKKEKFHPDAYYMLVDVWRHGSPRLETALRAFKLHVEGQRKPDYKAFMIGIFGLESMRPLMMIPPHAT